MVNWKKIGKITCISGLILTVLGYLWREVILNGLHLTYVVYWVDFAWGLFLVGGLMWLLAPKQQIQEDKSNLNTGKK